LKVTDEEDINGAHSNDSIAAEKNGLATSITKSRHKPHPTLTNLYGLPFGFFECVFSRNIQTFLLFLDLTLYPDQKDLMNFITLKILQDQCGS